MLNQQDLIFSTQPWEHCFSLEKGGNKWAAKLLTLLLHLQENTKTGQQLQGVLP